MGSRNLPDAIQAVREDLDVPAARAYEAPAGYRWPVGPCAQGFIWRNGRGERKTNIGKGVAPATRPQLRFGEHE